MDIHRARMALPSLCVSWPRGRDAQSPRRLLNHEPLLSHPTRAAPPMPTSMSSRPKPLAPPLQAFVWYQRVRIWLRLGPAAGCGCGARAAPGDGQQAWSVWRTICARLVGRYCRRGEAAPDRAGASNCCADRSEPGLRFRGGGRAFGEAQSVPGSRPMPLDFAPPPAVHPE